MRPASRIPILIVTVVALVAWAPSTAQQPIATASITGVVLGGTPNAGPLAGAVVTISRDAGRRLSTVTDSAGRFGFDHLPPGELRISASKPPYLTMAYGAMRTGRQGTAVSLQVGQHVAGLTIRLPRGAVIMGTIRDLDGFPLPDVAVSALRLVTDGPAQATRAVTTDGRGNYRIFGLQPGEYLIAGTRRFAGGAIEAHSTEDLDRRFALLERRASGRPPAATTSPATTTLAFAPVFFPGTTSVSDAQRVQLSAGEEEVLNFALGPVAAGTVTGAVRTDDGTPLPMLTLELEQTGPALPFSVTNRTLPALRPTPTDGRFAFTGVTPGHYSLSARADRPGGGAQGTLRWAFLDLPYAGQDLSGITLLLRPGLRLSGKAVADGAAGGLNFSSIRVALTMAATSNGTAPPLSLRRGPLQNTALRPDGTFEIADVVPGTYVVSAAGTGSLWLRSAIVDGQDALDVPVPFLETSANRSIELRFSERRGHLSGILTTSTQAPAVDFHVVVFTADQRLWRPNARRVRSVRPATDGRFAVPDLPGGEYFIAALTDVDPADLGDATFLAQLVPSAIKIVLAEGQRAVQNLAIAR